MWIIEALTQDARRLTESFESSATMFTTLVGFLLITWAFSQIVFPRLKRLDDMRNELIDVRLDEIEDDERGSEHYKKVLQEKAKELERIFIKYELTYKDGVWLAAKFVGIFAVIASVAVFLLSGMSYLLVLVTLSTICLLAALSLRTYPTIDTLRSLEYLTHKLGYNPWVIWGMMNQTIFWGTPLTQKWKGPLSDKLHVILKQDVFISGWNCYVEVGAHKTKKVFYAGKRTIKYDKNTARHYGVNGQNMFIDLGGIEHRKTKNNSYVDKERKEKHYIASVIIFMPVYPQEEVSPFVLREFAGISQDSYNYSGGGTTFNVTYPSSEEFIEIKGTGKRFDMKFEMRHQSRTNKKLFHKLRKLIPGNGDFELYDYNGQLEQNLNVFPLIMPVFVRKIKLFSYLSPVRKDLTNK